MTLPNSAFITVGESERTMREVAAGRFPAGEYGSLRDSCFSLTYAMADLGFNAEFLAAGMQFALRAYLSTWDTENIYLGEEFPGIQYLAVHAAFRRPKRIAMLIHNVASLKRRLPLATLRLGRLLDHVLCLSEQSKTELETTYGIPSSRISVIGSRVDTKFFLPEPSRPMKRQVCSAGAVNRDYETLVNAVAPLRVPTKIAADTAWRYSSPAAALIDTPDFVEMRSWGDYLNLRSLYAESAVVVVPLRKSVLSGVTVALEGMAMAKPVILTHNPYVEDFLRDGENGYFVKSGDVNALRDKIEFVLANPVKAGAVGAGARAWVLERFSVEQYVDRILSVWR